MQEYKTGKDLSTVAPVSPKMMLGGYVILARTIDKCRAMLWGNIGEYHFDCPVDKSLFGFKGVSSEMFRNFVAEGHSNEEIAEWFKGQGETKTDTQVAEFNAQRLANNMSQDPAPKKAWLEGENVRLGLDKDAPLFDMLLADDRLCFPASFK